MITSLVRLLLTQLLLFSTPLVHEQLQAKDNGGRTALMLAAAYGCPKCIKLLMEHDVSGQQLDWALMMLAITYKHNPAPALYGCLALMITRGAQPTQPDADVMSVLEPLLRSQEKKKKKSAAEASPANVDASTAVQQQTEQLSVSCEQ